MYVQYTCTYVRTYVHRVRTYHTYVLQYYVRGSSGARSTVLGFRCFRCFRGYDLLFPSFPPEDREPTLSPYTSLEKHKPGAMSTAIPGAAGAAALMATGTTSGATGTQDLAPSAPAGAAGAAEAAPDASSVAVATAGGSEPAALSAANTSTPTATPSALAQAQPLTEEHRQKLLATLEELGQMRELLNARLASESESGVVDSSAAPAAASPAATPAAPGGVTADVAAAPGSSQLGAQIVDTTASSPLGAEQPQVGVAPTDAGTSAAIAASKPPTAAVASVAAAPGDVSSAQQKLLDQLSDIAVREENIRRILGGEKEDGVGGGGGRQRARFG
jgi:hypothetical protein